MSEALGTPFLIQQEPALVRHSAPGKSIPLSENVFLCCVLLALHNDFIGIYATAKRVDGYNI